MRAAYPGKKSDNKTDPEFTEAVIPQERMASLRSNTLLRASVKYGHLMSSEKITKITLTSACHTNGIECVSANWHSDIIPSTVGDGRLRISQTEIPLKTERKATGSFPIVCDRFDLAEGS